MNFFKLILQASPIVQGVLLILLFFSVFSWAVIFFKRNTLNAAASKSKKFLEVFHKSQNLSEVNDAAKKYKGSPQSVLFRAGYRELAHLSKGSSPPNISPTKLESINRALIRASNGEISRLEKMMMFLATTGSVTPFIGLFGTVWGIMNAFTQLGVMKVATLDTVAPGIAEALIATALGLFAAIPAVVFYNLYLQRIKSVITQMEDFSLEFLNIIERLYGI
ncbi:protein TolQ [Acidobacteriota bacterium]